MGKEYRDWDKKMKEVSSVEKRDDLLDEMNNLKKEIEELELKRTIILMEQSDAENREQMWLIQEVLRSPDKNTLTDKIEEKEKKIKEILEKLKNIKD